jgi:tetratricopeptide (TPR) repeat protein
MEKTIETGLNWNQADAMRKEGRYAEALKIFIEHFSENKDEASLWRSILCARHLKDYQTAIELIEENYKEFEDSEMLRIQFAWLKYDAFMGKAKKSGNWDKVIKLADEIFQLNPENGEILFRLTLFAAIDAAKNLKDNEKLLELTDMVGPEKLAAKGETYKGRKMISWRERWYFARLQALFSAELFSECRSLAFKAFAEYPRKLEFARKAALCRIQTGEVKEAEEELIGITKARGCPWYVFADLAKIRFEMGRYEEALESAYDAAQKQGDLKTKVNLFSLIAKLLLITGNNDQAKNHSILACAIREKYHWKIPQDLENLKERFELYYELPAPENILNKCKQIWTKSSTKENSQIPATGAEIADKVCGTMGQIKEGRPFSFISSPGYASGIYVKLAEVPEELQHEGAEIVFKVIESFDHKKGQKSVRATNVRAKNNSEAIAA